MALGTSMTVTERMIIEEGYGNVSYQGEDWHAVYYEASRLESGVMVDYEFKRCIDTGALYGRLAGKEDWHYI